MAFLFRIHVALPLHPASSKAVRSRSRVKVAPVNSGAETFNLRELFMTENVEAQHAQHQKTGRRLLGAACLAVSLLGAAASDPADAAQKTTAAPVVRFLEQATFGPTPDLISHVQRVGFTAFLDEQFSMPLQTYPNLGYWPSNPPMTCTDACYRDNYTMYPLQARFFQNALTGPDQLRQRVAFALNQILVISAVNPKLRLPSRMLPYLEVLDRNAFGNFRQLLTDITLNPGMGRYLDMVGNHKKAPNENYARELLQLFSVGVNQLNLDGTPKLDGTGQPIPTYDQSAITNFARVFTGWVFAPSPALEIVNYFDPMVPGEPAAHDTSAKVLLNGVTLPAGQTAAADLQAALDNIFAHPNVAPFISQRLIQHLVTSNPSPAYVRRVATTFTKTHGDMKAVIRAILLDSEARSAPVTNANYGHLREPVLWITSLLRAFNTTAATTDFVLGDSFLPSRIRMAQDLFRSPSVFNFYPPDHVIAGDSILGPEFAIYSTTTALARANFGYQVTYQKMETNPFYRPLGTWLDLSSLLPLAANPAGLVDTLNQRLVAGAMGTAMRDIIITSVTTIPSTDSLGRVRNAVYLVVTSPQYLVER